MTKRTKILGLIVVLLGLIFLFAHKKEHSFEGVCYSLRSYIDKTKDVSFATHQPLHEPSAILNDLYACDCLYNYYSVEKDWLIRRRIVNLVYGARCGNSNGKDKDFFLSALKDENPGVRAEAKSAAKLLKIDIP